MNRLNKWIDELDVLLFYPLSIAFIAASLAVGLLIMAYLRGAF